MPFPTPLSRFETRGHLGLFEAPLFLTAQLDVAMRRRPQGRCRGNVESRSLLPGAMKLDTIGRLPRRRFP